MINPFEKNSESRQSRDLQTRLSAELSPGSFINAQFSESIHPKSEREQFTDAIAGLQRKTIRVFANHFAISEAEGANIYLSTVLYGSAVTRVAKFALGYDNFNSLKKYNPEALHHLKKMWNDWITLVREQVAPKGLPEELAPENIHRTLRVELEQIFAPMERDFAAIMYLTPQAIAFEGSLNDWFEDFEWLSSRFSSAKSAEEIEPLRLILGSYLHPIIEAGLKREDSLAILETSDDLEGVRQQLTEYFASLAILHIFSAREDSHIKQFVQHLQGLEQAGLLVQASSIENPDFRSEPYLQMLDYYVHAAGVLNSTFRNLTERKVLAECLNSNNLAGFCNATHNFPDWHRLWKPMSSWGGTSAASEFIDFLISEADRVVGEGQSETTLFQALLARVSKTGFRPGVVAFVKYHRAFIQAGLVDEALAAIRGSDSAERLSKAGCALLAGELHLAVPALEGQKQEEQQKRQSRVTKTARSINTRLAPEQYFAIRLPQDAEFAQRLTNLYRNGEPALQNYLRYLLERDRKTLNDAGQMLLLAGVEHDGLREILRDRSLRNLFTQVARDGREEQVNLLAELLQQKSTAKEIAAMLLSSRSDSEKQLSSDLRTIAQPALPLPLPFTIAEPKRGFSRILVIGGRYAQDSQEEIALAAGNLEVEFIAPDINQNIEARVRPDDYVIFNTTYSSHSLFRRIRAHCRTNDISFMSLHYRGKKHLLSTAAALSKLAD